MATWRAPSLAKSDFTVKGFRHALSTTMNRATRFSMYSSTSVGFSPSSAHGILRTEGDFN